MTDLERDERALTAVLRAAGARLDAPETDVTAGVLRGLAAEAPRRAAPRRVVLVAAALLVLALASAAVAALVVPGVQLRFGDPSQPQATQRLDPAVDLGEPVSAAGAAAALGGRAPWLLAGGAAGQPALYLHPHSEVVSAAYASSPALPELGDSGLGLVLSQFPSPDLPWFQKTLGGLDGVETVSVGGHSGLWIEGPHDLAFLPDGATRERVRRADNVLLWSVDGLTLRMESALGLDAALDLATTLRRGR